MPKLVSAAKSICTCLCNALFLGVLCASSQTPSAPLVDSSTVIGKVLVGYQGWFRCPGDGSQQNKWSHWFKGDPSAESLAVDLYPDTSGLNSVSLCALPGMTIAGRQAYVFSSLPRATAEKHFEWMAKYGIDGALVQRFATNIPELRGEGDAVLKNIRASAEDHGRVFAIEYDLSGAVSPESLKKVEEDWQYLAETLKVTESSAYLKQGGRPLVSLWGLGFGDTSHLNDPQAIIQLLHWFKETAHVTVMGGVPAGWRTLSGDSRASSTWSAVYDALDIVQPWNVGRYRTLADVDHWQLTHLKPDLERTRQHRQIYMPVIFPGFSWHNLNPGQSKNQIPRLGGRFLWRQASLARVAGVRTVKIAMFDEVNEGTAIFNVASTRDAAPKQGYWLTLDADGETLPGDWYLQLAGQITRIFDGELPTTFSFPPIPSVPGGRHP